MADLFAEDEPALPPRVSAAKASEAFVEKDFLGGDDDPAPPESEAVDPPSLESSYVTLTWAEPLANRKYGT